MTLLKATKKQYLKVIPSNHFGLKKVKLYFCPMCNVEIIGGYSYRDYPYKIGVTAVCIEGGRICQKCYNGIGKQKPVDSIITNEEKQHNALYNQFLKGKAYPEIKIKLTLFDKQNQPHQLDKPVKSYRTFLNSLAE